MQIEISFMPDFTALIERIKQTYPAKLFNLEGIGDQLDMAEFSKQFFADASTTADASVDANSNVDDLTVVAYEHEHPKPFARLNSLYLLWKYGRKLFGKGFADAMVEKEIAGDYYINDLSNVQKPYCYNFSAIDIAFKGLPFVKKIESSMPKHLSSFVGQVIHFSSYASNQVMGAVGLADVLIVLSHYVKLELDEHEALMKTLFGEDRSLMRYRVNSANKKKIWKQVEQEIQSIVYSMNQPFRAGLQSGFYNVSVYDQAFLEAMHKEYVFPDGSSFDIDLVKRLQDIFLSMMNKTMDIKPITFPVTTASFCIDERRDLHDEEFLQYIAEKNKKWGFVNIYAGDSSTLSSCCRLRSKKENSYLGYTNSFGSGGTQIGSFGVVTLNLPHIAAKAKGDLSTFLTLLAENADCAIKINHIKRHILSLRIKMGALPLYTHGFMSLERQYATIGLNGIYEAIGMLGEDLVSEGGQSLCTTLLTTLNGINAEADKKTGYAHNLEQTPSENSAIKLAQKDKAQGLQNEYELYSNQFIPLTASANMLERIRLQGMFDSEFSGGSILHLNCDSRVEDADNLAGMIRATIKAGCVYHAINYVLECCDKGHLSVGKHEHCQVCGKPITDLFSRVVGFFVNVKNMHKVRRTGEFPNRKFYSGKEIEEIK